MFTATIEGDLERVWGSITNIIRDGAALGVLKGTREGAAEMRHKHTFKNVTHVLEQSMEGQGLGWSGNTYTGVIRVTAKHARLVEEPTIAHIIRPKSTNKSGFLHWERPQGDHHFARVVNHPGTKGKPFMHIAYYKCEAVITREVELSVARAAALLR